MTNRRKKAEEAIYQFVESVLPGGGNKEMYQRIFAKMSDADFEERMRNFRDGKESIVVVIPNGNKVKLSTARNLKYAEKIGHNFFPHLNLTDPGIGITYRTPIPYLVMDLTLRRQAQMMEKKRSIPEKITNIDQLTDQPTGASKGAKVSFTELQYMRAQGLMYTAQEFIAVRGGNMKALRAMQRGLIESGTVDLNEIAKAGGRVKSSVTVSILLRSQHIDNNWVQ